MVSYEEVIQLLEELNLSKSEENIKWAYNTLLKEIKTQVKIWTYEKEYDEDFWESYDECCCEDCDCDDDDSCCDGNCCCE